MSGKSTAAIPVSILATLLHAGCCLLPFLLAGFGTSLHLYAFAQYKPFMAAFQIALICYLCFKLLSLYLSQSHSHNRTEKWSYAASLLISLAGLALGLLEPLRTEDQKLAMRRFEYFKNHGQVSISIEGDFDQKSFLSDLRAIQGVRPASVKWSGKAVSVSYLKNETSRTDILLSLKCKGYQVVCVE